MGRTKLAAAVLTAACLTAGLSGTVFAQTGGQNAGERTGRLVKTEYYWRDIKTRELVVNRMDKIEYDAEGNPSRIFYKLDASGEIRYDTSGISFGGSEIETVICDGKGRPIETEKEVMGNSVKVLRKTTYLYNGAGKRSEEQIRIDVGQQGVDRQTVYEYNDNGKKVVMRTETSEFLWEYLYGGNGYYLLVKNMKDGVPNIGNDSSYDMTDIQQDEAGHIISYKEKWIDYFGGTSFEVTTITYDAYGRMIGGKEESWRENSSSDGTRYVNQYRFSYDEYGNLTEIIREDKDGNIDRKIVYSYDYNAGPPAQEAIEVLDCYPKPNPGNWGI